jgi:hypothetical protein
LFVVSVVIRHLSEFCDTTNRKEKMKKKFHLLQRAAFLFRMFVLEKKSRG